MQTRRELLKKAVTTPLAIAAAALASYPISRSKPSSPTDKKQANPAQTPPPKTNIATELAKQSNPTLNEALLLTLSIKLETDKIIRDKQKKIKDPETRKQQCCDALAGFYGAATILIITSLVKLLSQKSNADLLRKSFGKLGFNFDDRTWDNFTTMNIFHLQTHCFTHFMGMLIPEFTKILQETLDEDNKLNQPQYGNDPRKINLTVVFKKLQEKNFLSSPLKQSLKNSCQEPWQAAKKFPKMDLRNYLDLALIALSYPSSIINLGFGRAVANIPRSGFISRKVLKATDDKHYDKIRARYTISSLSFPISHIINGLIQSVLQKSNLKANTGNLVSDNAINDLTGLLFVALVTIFQAPIKSQAELAATKSINSQVEQAWTNFIHKYIKPEKKE